ncbi:hypothetical protein [Ureibacillus manganicus]|uniref:Uncharacterized protein n=1 Tax=Ureibacillus manganicus DSM 26584 TaxID=1384049 RepID=A0A0A3HYL9_9BACL|nr:hypothetical protein [Ureibacillus manganicus]KGR77701.1 hypothetical protein CD29_13690 [Ureibacillus manganicus DSM 26584]
MLLFILIVVPLIGAIWFYNLAVFMEKLKNGKNPHNQKVLGATLTFILLAAIMFSLLELNRY